MTANLLPTSVLLVLAFGPAVVLPGGQPQGDPQTQLAKTTLKAAHEAYRQLLEEENKGRRAVDPESRYVWSKRILEAECEVARDKKGCAAAFKSHFERMMELERRIKNQAKVGGVGLDRVSAADYFRAEAEHRWVQAMKNE